MTCSTNDPSIKIDKWKVSKVLGRNNDLIYYGNWTANESKYKWKNIGSIRKLIIRNFKHPFLHLWASCLKTNQYQPLFSVNDL
jgi:hypothetical protein